MKFNVSLKVAVVMILSVIIITFTITTLDHLQYRDLLIENERNQINEIEKTVISSLETIEQAYFIFEQELTSLLQENTYEIIDLYKDNPNYFTWDFEALKKQYDMDIYIINNENKIVASSFEKDIGLDFIACCKTLAKILDERRETGELYIDEMDVEQETGEVKKYSYMATPDKEYLIQLGYSLYNSPIFNVFNFLNTISELESVHPSIDKIKILNIGGLALGNSREDASKDRRKAFIETRATRKTTEINSELDGQSVINRYVHYSSQYNVDYTEDKVIEITYNQTELAKSLRDKNIRFVLQLFVVLLVISITALIMQRWIANKVYIANHDNLTELKNRRAFNELISRALAKQTGKVALFMIDLDNFKLVNDYFGHDKGDLVLKIVAQSILSTAKGANKSSEVFRLGGDEFAIILPSATEKKSAKLAKLIIENINKRIQMENELRHLDVTASIGIAFSDQGLLDQNELYKRGDLALYNSKEKGRNQHCIYTSNMI